jgi:uncharacterized protein
MTPLRHLLRMLLAAVLLLAALQVQARQVPVPPLTGHVSDQAGLLAPEQRAKLDAVLVDYEKRTGSQIAVLLVKSTEPEAIEQYGIRVADAWKLGRKGIDDGVLLLVASENPSSLRRLRIEAGRGVQGVLTDAKSKRVLQDVIAPHFREKHFYEGLVAGVGAISTLLDTEKFAAPAARQQQPAAQEQGGGLLMPILIFAAILFAIFRPRGRARGLASESWGSGATGFIIGSALSQLGRHGGGGGGGGGFSGGGFSGGGGGFDGGGASGDW